MSLCEIQDVLITALSFHTSRRMLTRLYPTIIETIAGKEETYHIISSFSNARNMFYIIFLRYTFCSYTFLKICLIKTRSDTDAADDFEKEKRKLFFQM